MKNYIKDNILYINLDNNIISNRSDYNKVSINNKILIDDSFNEVVISICYYNNILKKEIVKIFKYFKDEFLMLKRYKGKTKDYTRLLISIEKEELKDIL